MKIRNKYTCHGTKSIVLKKQIIHIWSGVNKKWSIDSISAIDLKVNFVCLSCLKFFDFWIETFGAG